MGKFPQYSHVCSYQISFSFCFFWGGVENNHFRNISLFALLRVAVWNEELFHGVLAYVGHEDWVTSSHFWAGYLQLKPRQCVAACGGSAGVGCTFGCPATPDKVWG